MKIFQKSQILNEFVYLKFGIINFLNTAYFLRLLIMNFMEKVSHVPTKGLDCTQQKGVSYQMKKTFYSL